MSDFAVRRTPAKTVSNNATVLGSKEFYDKDGRFHQYLVEQTFTGYLLKCYMDYGYSADYHFYTESYALEFMEELVTRFAD